MPSLLLLLLRVLRRRLLLLLLRAPATPPRPALVVRLLLPLRNAAAVVALQLQRSFRLVELDGDLIAAER